MGVDGVFSAEGDAWRTRRKLAVLALTQDHLRGLYPKLQTVTTRLKKRWEATKTSSRVKRIAGYLGVPSRSILGEGPCRHRGTGQSDDRAPRGRRGRHAKKE